MNIALAKRKIVVCVIVQTWLYRYPTWQHGFVPGDGNEKKNQQNTFSRRLLNKSPILWVFSVKNGKKFSLAGESRKKPRPEFFLFKAIHLWKERCKYIWLQFFISIVLKITYSPQMNKRPETQRNFRENGQVGPWLLMHRRSLQERREMHSVCINLVMSPLFTWISQIAITSYYIKVMNVVIAFPLLVGGTKSI